MRFIRLNDNNEVISIRIAESIVEGEIQSDVGELGQIMQADGIFIDSVPPLEQAKTSKLEQLYDLYNQKLSNGFNSTVTGTAYTFGYGQSDREKFMQLAISVLSNIATFPVPVPAKNGTIVLFDQAQYQQLLTDINAFGWTMQNKLHEFSGQVHACTTIDEVNSIVVSF